MLILNNSTNASINYFEIISMIFRNENCVVQFASVKYKDLVRKSQISQEFSVH